MDSNATRISGNITIPDNSLYDSNVKNPSMFFSVPTVRPASWKAIMKGTTTTANTAHKLEYISHGATST